VERRRGQRVIAGLVLIGLGLFLYTLELYGGLGRTTVIFVAGAAFLGAYLASKTFGFLVPASLLLCVGAGDVIERFTGLDAASTLWLGIGFLGVTAFAWMYEGRRAVWPLVPGVLLVLFSVPRAWRVMADAIQDHWPLLLVVIGIAVLFGAFGGSAGRGRAKPAD
jgi:hypothetical protein